MPVRFHRPRALAMAASAAFTCAAASAPASGPPRLEPVWIETATPDGEPKRDVPALLNTPPGWAPGDTAAVVLSDEPWPGLARERLVAALLEEGAAVLELDVNTARGFGPENALAGPPPTMAQMAPDVQGAAEALRRGAKAGLVVALGHGAGGDAAVLAALSERAVPADGPAAAGLVAAASLGPGPALFASGGARAGPGWPVRAARLCGALAAATPFGARAEADCRRTLLEAGALR